MRHLKDLQEFICALQAIGEIQVVDAEVDWDLEIGAVIRRSYDLRATAPLFTNITGYQGSGFKVLGAPGGLSGPAHPLARVALSLGLPATATGREIVETVAAARERPGVPPRAVPAEEAPCKQNIVRGHDVDLTRFPTPRIHANDGGRYLQTYGMNVVRTPDGSWTNWSVNRMMIAGKDRLACLIPPVQHMGIIRAQWAAPGQAMPVVTALGVEPGLPMVGGMPLPEGADESHFLGALLGEPVEVTFAGKAGFGVPKVLVVEDDIDITNLNEVVWAFATRAHPEHGEIHFPSEPTQTAGEVYLDEAEAHSYKAGKVIYNCLLADRFPKGRRPVKGDLQHAWPKETQERVLRRWSEYGYAGNASAGEAQPSTGAPVNVSATQASSPRGE